MGGDEHAPAFLPHLTGGAAAQLAWTGYDGTGALNACAISV
ncbi:hypothetical protein [Streptomyces sp. NPDC053079]